MSDDADDRGDRLVKLARPCVGMVHAQVAPTFASYARSVVQGRAKIGRYFDPNLFSDPVFDILLDLFAAAEEGMRVASLDCAAIARVPATTGLRYIKLLERRGIVETYPDDLDRRRTLVRLTPASRILMEKYLSEISSIPLTR